MTNLTITPYPNIPKLNEIYQTVDLKFSFLLKISDSEYKQQNPPCKCRDYLHDIVDSNLTGKGFGIYGMTYSPSEFPIDLEVLRYNLKFPDKNKKAWFIENFNYLKEIEKKASIPESLFIDVDEVSLILESNKFWMQNSVLVSLHSYICRMLCYQNLKLSGKDQQYITLLKQNPKFEPLLENVSVLKTNSFHGWGKMHTNLVHDHSGILTFVRGPDSYDALSQNENYQELVSNGVL